VSAQTRTLKIEAIGDFAYRKIKPRIRLSGRWLERAGFRPGHRVEISSSKAGELSLQFREDCPQQKTTPTILGRGFYLMG
jgi:hypothetical protein